MRVDRSFVLLDSNQSVEDALESVRLHSGAHYVIVRRERGSDVFWYAYLRHDFEAEAKGQQPLTTLESALDLHEDKSSPTYDEGSDDIAIPGAVVLSERGRLAGVLEMDTRFRVSDGLEDADEDGPIGGGLNYGGGGGGSRTRRSVAGGMLEHLRIPRYPDAAPPPPPQPAPPLPRASRPKRGARPPAPAAGAPPARAGRDARIGAVHAPPQRAPFAAWPDLVAPKSVRELETFEIEIGFAPKKQAGVTGGPVVLVDAPPEFDLRVQVVGVGFEAPDGWSHELHVERDNPYSARLKLTLVAELGEQPIETRNIAVQFYHEYSLCGQAQCSVVVAKLGVPDSERSAAGAKSPRPSSAPVRLVPGERPPDLTATVRLDRRGGALNTFVWSLESPHPVSFPESPALTELDQEVGPAVDALLQQLVNLAPGPTADNAMRGIARQIARRIPTAFWMALKEVARAIGLEKRAPDILLVTEETRLPWELAWMEERLYDDRCNHLGAQVNIGRWILGAPRPLLPPADRVPWRRMAVVVGNYKGGAALPDALEEAKNLKTLLDARATQFELNGKDLDPFLEAEAPPDGCQLVHFACHGRAKNAEPALTHLLMQDGTPFSPLVLEGSELGEKWEPFLFLNACEVGRTGFALGETAGFAGAALAQGFRGFVGPLWQVDSRVAREVAEEFYRRTLEENEAVSAVLRDLRCNYTYGGANAAPRPDTYLAYVFYGHPGLKLTRDDSKNGD